MRKKLAVVMLCSLCAAAGYGQSANFTSPGAGETWYAGTVKTISWTWSGSAMVKLVLYSKNDDKQWVIQSNLKLGDGAYAWKVATLENGKTSPFGTGFQLRLVKMADNSIIATSLSVAILAPPPPTAAVKGKMNRPAETFSSLHPQVKEMALASVPPPAGTPFTIKKIDYYFASEGKVGTVIVTISTNSPAGFYISPNYGDPEYGAQWIEYRIENPLYEGFVCGGKHFCYGTVSVKEGGGTGRLNHPLSPVPAGPCDYFISFKPDYDGLAKGIGLVQKMPNSPFQPGNLCRREFYPKLRIFFSACTAAGTVKSSSSVYLVYNPGVWPLCWLSVPGETNVCAGGIQYW